MMDDKTAINLSARYFVLVVIGIFQAEIFYTIFTPLTVYPSFWILSLFYKNAFLLEGNVLFYAGVYARIISACVGGAAYYLLLILNLTTPMDVMKRVKSIVFLVIMFLFLNILRISAFAGLATLGNNYFDVAHEIMWYFGSTIMIVLIWFLCVSLFKIGGIPVYTDIKEIYGEIQK
jgi:exosortase/archaeosortase family protein